MHKDIREFIREIDSLKLPVKSEIFAGAGLIITADPNRYRKEHDIVVLSNEAESLSSVSYTHLRSPRDRQKSRMPSSA